MNVKSQDKGDCESSPELPDVIDPAVVAGCFREHTNTLVENFRHCLSSLADSLYSQSIIPEDAQRKTQKESLDEDEKSRALLSCVKARLQTEPLDFKKFVNILKAEPFLDTLGSKLVQSYCILSSKPTTECPAAISPAISEYAAYLKGVYKKATIPSGKWPPTPSKNYIKLATVEKEYKCRDEFIGHTLRGNIKEILESKKEISIDMILVPDEKSVADLKLVLIEGAPGIGKSTLAWQLCKRWEQGCIKEYSLTVLLRLREKEIQKISSDDELFCFCQNKEVLIKEISSENGKGILFILDGFDELPITLQKEGVLVNLIKGNLLPKCTVVVTSRPSATAELLTICHPKHIEILGFTQESVDEYASDIFSSEPEKLLKFKRFISASENPAINSLMYVPLNAAIIVQIYLDNNSEHLLPHNLTQLYNQLCCTILKRYLRENHSSVRFSKFENLPGHLYQEFLNLSKIAFDGMRRQEVIFHELPSDLVHFDFLDAISSLYGAGSVSYNFLHLTLQEFFAAYHISQFSDDARQKLLRKCGSDKHWNVVWRFVAGLTKFEFLGGQLNDDFASKNTENKVEVNPLLIQNKENKVEVKPLFIQYKENEGEVKPLFIQCFYEANIKMDESKLFKCKNFKLDFRTLPPLDFYALGYCIANLTREVSWNITVEARFLNFFVSGLKKSDSISNSNINELCLIMADRDTFPYLSRFPLCGIPDLTLINPYFSPSDLTNLSKFLPSMTSLKRLSVKGNLTDPFFKFFHCCDKFLRQLSQTTVTSLALPKVVLASSISALQLLIDPGRGKLEELYIYSSHDHDGIDDTQLLDMVCAPSSLKHLALYNPHNFFSLMELETNTCLTKLEIVYQPFHYPDHGKMEVIVQIMEQNKTLEDLIVGIFLFSLDIVGDIVEALHRNKTLKSITLMLHREFADFTRPDEFNNPKILWKYVSWP